MNRIVEQYTRYHGGPEGLSGFSRWLTEQYMSAMVDKNARQLLETLRDPTRSLDAFRLMGAGATLDDFAAADAAQ